MRFGVFEVNVLLRMYEKEGIRTYLVCRFNNCKLQLIKQPIEHSKIDNNTDIIIITIIIIIIIIIKQTDIHIIRTFMYKPSITENRKRVRPISF